MASETFWLNRPMSTENSRARRPFLSNSSGPESRNTHASSSSIVPPRSRRANTHEVTSALTSVSATRWVTFADPCSTVTWLGRSRFIAPTWIWDQPRNPLSDGPSSSMATKARNCGEERASLNTGSTTVPSTTPASAAMDSALPVDRAPRSAAQCRPSMRSTSTRPRASSVPQGLTARRFDVDCATADSR